MRRFRQTDVDDENLSTAADAQSAGTFSLVKCDAPRLGVGTGNRQQRTPAAVRESLTDRRVDAVQRQAPLGQPAAQVTDARGVVVVEVRPRREQLDGVEPVCADLEQMVPTQPLTVIEVRRDAERSFASHGRLDL